MRSVRHAAAGGWALTLALTLAACGGGGDSTEPPAPSDANPSLARIEPYERTVSMGAVLARSLEADPGVRVQPEAIVLEPLQWRALKRVDPRVADRRAVAVGLSRSVAATADVTNTSSQWTWQPLESGGWAAAIRLRAPDSAGVRPGLWVRQLPAGAVVRTFGVGGGGEVTAATIRATLDRLRASESARRDEPLYWLPLVYGQEATVQIELPAGVDPAQVQVALPRVALLWSLPGMAGDLRSEAPGIGELRSAETCHVNATCSPGYEAQGRSVARLLIIQSNGDAVLCSGVLLADTARSGRAFLLTARHCVASADEAASVETYWFYRSSTCDGGATARGAARRTGGADLLRDLPDQDATLLELTAPSARPPDGVVHAGSLLGRPVNGTDLAGLHHPAGAPLKLSLGSLRGTVACTSNTPGSLSCARTTEPSAGYLSVTWSQGITEGGSSGSPAFATVAGQRYVVGHLSAGSSTCADPAALDYYSRFDRVFPALRDWLSPQVP
jgi:lysyl endopeptidase